MDVFLLLCSISPNLYESTFILSLLYFILPRYLLCGIHMATLTIQAAQQTLRECQEGKLREKERKLEMRERNKLGRGERERLLHHRYGNIPPPPPPRCISFCTFILPLLDHLLFAPPSGIPGKPQVCSGGLIRKKLLFFNTGSLTLQIPL